MGIQILNFILRERNRALGGTEVGSAVDRLNRLEKCMTILKTPPTLPVRRRTHRHSMTASKGPNASANQDLNTATKQRGLESVIRYGRSRL